ncbi:MAG: hypothetical protein KME40_19720 [Komarekiella atlantica HA4396-MV6]|nr:hypothetical protein [Komarekiella atlantica HA4396-MV6]
MVSSDWGNEEAVLLYERLRQQLCSATGAEENKLLILTLNPCTDAINRVSTLDPCTDAINRVSTS